MPEGSKVDEVFEALKDKGYDEGKAARIAQSQTGEALATGKPPRPDAHDHDHEPPRVHHKV